MQDHELLLEFTRDASQEAFRELVVRHLDAVYASARRQVRDPGLAQDVTQAVFIVLARKATQLAHVKAPLAGWLMKTTYFASRDAIKQENRRKRYEQEAAKMAPAFTEQDLSTACEQLSPELDHAMTKLSDLDRGAITLRYLQGDDISEVASAMGLSPAAATKRITRALDRLRRYLVRRDSSLAVIPIGSLLEHLPRMNAPATLTETTFAVATAPAGSASSFAVSISKGAMNMMMWSKIKAAAIMVGAIIAIGGAGVGTFSLVQAQSSGANATKSDPLSYMGQLKSGTSVELIGLAEYPSSGKPWWRADGSLLKQAPYDHLPLNMASAGGGAVREVAYRINMGRPSRTGYAPLAGWQTNGFNWPHALRPLSEANALVQNIDASVMILNETPDGATLRLNVATGPWKTIFTAPGKSASMQTIDKTQYMLSTPNEANGVTRYTLVRTGPAFAGNEQIVAIDMADGERPFGMNGRGGGNGTITQELAVRLPADSIKEIRIQQRPYDQWIEFRHVALQAGQLSQVQVVTSDDPPKDN